MSARHSRRRPGVAVALAVGLLLTGCGEVTTTSPDRAPTATQAAPERLPVAAPDRATGPAAVAGRGVVASLQYSWRDRSIHSWVNRLIRLSTDVYASHLEETYWDVTPAETSAWEDLVADRRQTRVRVDSTRATRVDAGTRTVDVAVTVQRRDASATTWRTPQNGERTYRVRVVKVGRAWRVDAID